MLYRLLANAAIVEPEDGVAAKLRLAESEGRPLRVKLGFDPTAPDLHLGHAVVLQKLRDFQEAGHRIVVIIGDFTASIGDPTGRNKLRPPLTAEEIDANAETYLAQLGKVVDTDDIEVRRNSEWHGKLDLAATIRLMASVTVAQIMARDDFRNRFQGGLPIHLHELLYPILQGYDSVMIDADIELGGTDQLFNNLMGRHLQEAAGKPGQAVMCMPLLVGTDGSDKMSKSKANYVGLTDAPEDMFGKLMSISDAMLPNYLDLTTTFDADAKREMLRALEAGENPMALKKALAENVTDRFHGAGAGSEARGHFERTVQRKAPAEEDHAPLAVADLPDGATLLDLCAAALPSQSRGALKRLIAGGGVRVDGDKVEDPGAPVIAAPGRKVWIGKRDRFVLS
ncbi:tyrosine--tRNA ligase [Jannaschia sp. W003]|uniref:tyrosine--tRNA ligase n=1 Tax=Jannaschia sp. W003 TaxID=2867012 RepID=UPI0021A521BB|nr:tyrosine--tRNA ligase [Jannaschia sp. W003]UWQ20470.1 tyrosine--tRNA ligase [Jannaschia sp. W003]